MSDEQKMSMIVGRFRQAIEDAGGPRRVARESHVSERTLQLYMAGEADPKIGRVAAVARFCGVSLDWLMGMEPPDGTDKIRYRLGPAAEAAIADLALVGQAHAVPVMDVRIQPGEGEWFERADVTEQFITSAAYLERLGVSPSQVRGLRVAGDGMAPTLADGALVLIDASRREPANEGLYLVVVEGYAQIKRIQRAVDGSISFISDNSALYPAERLTRAEFDRLEIGGRVFWAERIL